MGKKRSKRVKSISNQKSKLILQTKLLVFISIVSILFTLLCLMFVPIICKNMNWFIGLLALNYLFTCTTVVFTYILVRNSIFDSEYEQLD